MKGEIIICQHCDIHGRWGSGEYFGEHFYIQREMFSCLPLENGYIKANFKYDLACDAYYDEYGESKVEIYSCPICGEPLKTSATWDFDTEQEVKE